MSDTAAGLIQMNSKMVVTRDANTMIVGGMIVAVVFALLLIIMATEKVKDKEGRRRKLFRVAAMAFMVLVGVVLVITGNNMPRVKEIHACASGPLSLEAVGARYDVISVDGRELILRER